LYACVDQMCVIFVMLKVGVWWERVKHWTTWAAEAR